MAPREIMRTARRDLHRGMSIPALYLLSPAEPLAVTVRVHTKFNPQGELKGSNFHYAESEDVIPRIIFQRVEIDKPARGAVISVEPGEAYRIDHVLPPDDEFVTAAVSPLLSAETIDLAVP